MTTTFKVIKGNDCILISNIIVVDLWPHAYNEYFSNEECIVVNNPANVKEGATIDHLPPIFNILILSYDSSNIPRTK